MLSHLIAKKVKDDVLHIIDCTGSLHNNLLHNKIQRPTCYHVPCLGHPMPLSSSRYVCSMGKLKAAPSHSLSLHLRPELRNNGISDISPSVLHPGRSCGVISLGARSLKA